jgi:mono/diheme cytochrome c family protein
MPATEQTWRDSKLLHIVFGVSGVAMLITTVWMLAADHNREWKPVQRKFREIETWYTQAKINDQDDSAFQEKTAELEKAVAETEAAPPAEGIVTSFLDEARPRVDQNGYNLARIEEADKNLREIAGKADDDSQQQSLKKARADLIQAMDEVVRKAQFDEDKRFSLLKFRRADLDVVRSNYNLGVGEGLPEAELQERQTAVDEVVANVNEMTLEYQQAKTHRLELEQILGQAGTAVAAAKKALADHLADLDRLQKAKADRQLSRSKEILDLPIINAFNSPLKIEQIWLPKLTLNNNFSDVARFDRCITCHQAIDKSAAGPGSLPAYPPRPHEFVALTVKTPAEAPEELKKGAPKDEKALRDALWQVYGLQLADQGLLDARDVTVSVVKPESPAAEAQFQIGDVLYYVNDVDVANERNLVYRYLLDSVAWGKPLTVRVNRGLPHPFSSHPRLDLFVGSLSPHKMMDMGCTICHEGQGSATSFQWASHTPNDPHEMAEWQKEHGWFSNHHWIFPMRPERFLESSCLKCHFNVTELEPSERFPDPPAPNLVEGFNIIRQYGCFGCHEINGYDGPSRRRGPDMRVEPNYGAVAASVLTDQGLNDYERQLAEQIIEHPTEKQPRKLLAEMLADDAAAKASTGDDAKQARLNVDTHRLGTLLGTDDETPGTYRKVGPSLRFVKSKLDTNFLANWIRDPLDFRPTTRMPKFFGLDGHLREIRRDEHGRPEMEEKLDADGKVVLDEEGEPVLVPVYAASPGLEKSEKFEPVEIRAVTEYLLDISQPFKYIEKQQGVEEASAERGKVVFQVRGCLACHQHKDFPDAKDTQGPDLSRVGDKLTSPDAAKWLYSWVREPKHYNSRTVMPNLFLEPVTGADGKTSDPAADVTAYLLSSRDGWKAGDAPTVVEKDLDDLAAEYLRSSFTNRQTEDYLKNGIPAKLRDQLKVDERLLIATDGMTPEENTRHKLLYVGRRTIGRLGCAGCHDIPGFEDAKAIGTGLADWGRKEPSKLAFEQVVQYIAQENFVHGHGHVHNIEQALDPHNVDPDTGFFLEAVVNHEREGFIWQKLREPRSYDYRMTENKDYIDRLRMPKFNLTDKQREAVITFVLGLVAEPPAAQYVYKPDPRRQAVLDGERLITKFNCDGCHTFRMESWEFDYDPKTFPEPPPFDDYAFEKPHFTPKELADSKRVDIRGLGHAKVTGMVNPEVAEDDDGNPQYYFGLWKSVPINGQPWIVGGPEVPVAESKITKKIAPYGGSFARFLHPVALAMEQATNPNAKASDAWGWVPPPLLNEGVKVQTQWLHDFLLNPYPIRPAVVLRMPRFNMSSEEATQLANYFAAADGAQYPYLVDHRTDSSYLAEQDQKHPKRFEDALKIITGNEYCVKCHKVGDYTPAGSAAALAPNLDRVYQRLRPDFVEKWIGNPKRLLPYTGMPVNFPPDKPADQALFPGSSLDQVEGVVDFLMNYDAYMKDRTSIKPMVKPAPPATTSADAAGEE